jgi:hypothetical protein
VEPHQSPSSSPDWFARGLVTLTSRGVPGTDFQLHEAALLSLVNKSSLCKLQTPMVASGGLRVMGMQRASSRILAPARLAALPRPNSRSWRSAMASAGFVGPAGLGRRQSNLDAAEQNSAFAGVRGVRHQRSPADNPLTCLPRRWMATADAPFSSEGQDLVCMRDLKLRWCLA